MKPTTKPGDRAGRVLTCLLLIVAIILAILGLWIGLKIVGIVLVKLTWLIVLAAVIVGIVIVRVVII